MMDARQLRALLDAPAPVVSIYVPLMPEERDVRAPEDCLRNAVEQAERLLESQTPDRELRDSLLAPARAALESDLKEHRDPGLALLLSKGQSQVIPLPESPQELVVVGQHVHIKPLLPILAGNRRFHILALSAARVRLLTATALGWEERELTELPPDAQAELDSLPAASVETRDGARMALLVQQPNRIKHAVHAALGGDPAPVVLVAEPHLAGNFIKVAKLPQLLGETVEVNPFALSDADLHARALGVIQPLLQAEVETLVDQVNARLGSAENTVAIRLEEILAAADDGRVDAVLVAQDEVLWGQHRPGHVPSAHGHEVPGDEDLLNVACVQTLRTGGRAFTLPRARLPRQAPAVATLRY